MEDEEGGGDGAEEEEDIIAKIVFKQIFFVLPAVPDVPLKGTFEGRGGLVTKERKKACLQDFLCTHTVPPFAVAKERSQRGQVLERQSM